MLFYELVVCKAYLSLHINLYGKSNNTAFAVKSIERAKCVFASVCQQTISPRAVRFGVMWFY